MPMYNYNDYLKFNINHRMKYSQLSYGNIWGSVCPTLLIMCINISICFTSYISILLVSPVIYLILFV